MKDGVGGEREREREKERETERIKERFVWCSISKSISLYNIH